MPADRGTLKAIGTQGRNEDDELKRIGERESAEFARRHLSREELALLDRPREPPVRAALTCDLASKLGPDGALNLRCSTSGQPGGSGVDSMTYLKTDQRRQGTP
jgi:hypothetical protein